MKLLLISFLLFSCINRLPAQLTIAPGAHLYMSGASQLTLNNMDFVNNGIFTRGSSNVSFNGNASSFISGSGAVIFNNLEINKTAGSSVLLQRFTLASNQVNFTAGYLNLNGFDFGLGNSGSLNNEQETSRAIGPAGGHITFTAILNAPSNANPGNLGARISSSQNMGTVLVRRGHLSQVNSFGQGSSIFRYYDINPLGTNTNLNATLQFEYFDGELNSLNESTLVFWRSTDAVHWTNEGFDTRHTIINYVGKNGINSFSRWTLSSPNNPLPVQFTLFNIKCEDNNVIINWKTAQEINSSHFNIERSNDGINWTVISRQQAAGFSSTEKMYSFTDNNPGQKSFYRLAQYDVDGRVQYTKVLRSTCENNDRVKVWPNPFNEMLFVNISTNSRSLARVKIFDSKGALVKDQSAEILPGTSQVNIGTKNLPSGTYRLVIEWNNGLIRKTEQVIKQ
ncbi:MAG TPA: T9SS type A sorting domain-containing protein [Ferruginibacter sp.]|nr:T9SS type A sorting domain-containing protein [Ferruginibacter sp.]